MNESPAFYEQMHEIREPYRRLAAAISETVGPVSSVRDIGAGVGHVVLWFAERGHDARGWELPAAIEHARDARHLLDTSRDGWAPADLVICTETAEHAPEAEADALVRDVARVTGRLLVWSAAPPGLEWEGHVNLQPPAYWLAKLRAHGLSVDEFMSARLRGLMRASQAQHHLGAQAFFVLRRVA